MRYHEIATHPAKHNQPQCSARLSVFRGERSALDAICEKYGPTQIIGVEKVPMIPACEIEVLCRDAQTARALEDAWWRYGETSPHRPHGEKECMEWGKQFNPFPNIPKDWTF